MEFSLMSAEKMEPKIQRRACGGWLATSPKWAPLHIGVIGATEEEAASRFGNAVTAWTTLLAED